MSFQISPVGSRIIFEDRSPRNTSDEKEEPSSSVVLPQQPTREPFKTERQQHLEQHSQKIERSVAAAEQQEALASALQKALNALDFETLQKLVDEGLQPKNADLAVSKLLHIFSEQRQLWKHRITELVIFFLQSDVGSPIEQLQNEAATLLKQSKIVSHFEQSESLDALMQKLAKQLRPHDRGKALTQIAGPNFEERWAPIALEFAKGELSTKDRAEALEACFQSRLRNPLTREAQREWMRVALELAKGDLPLKERADLLCKLLDGNFSTLPYMPLRTQLAQGELLPSDRHQLLKWILSIKDVDLLFINYYQPVALLLAKGDLSREAWAELQELAQKCPEIADALLPPLENDPPQRSTGRCIVS